MDNIPASKKNWMVSKFLIYGDYTCEGCLEWDKWSAAVIGNSGFPIFTWQDLRGCSSSSSIRNSPFQLCIDYVGGLGLEYSPFNEFIDIFLLHGMKRFLLHFCLRYESNGSNHVNQAWSGITSLPVANKAFSCPNKDIRLWPIQG